MAKLLTQTNRKPHGLKDFNTSVEGAYKSQLESKYAIFLEGKPSFVTVYTQNKNTSTVDINLDGTVELLGNDSSIRFNKINDFPIYGIKEVDFDSDLTQYGNDVSQIEGELLTLPNTLKLVPNDIIVLAQYKDFFFIKITNVSASHVSGKSFYRCNYQLVTPREEIQNQVEEDFITDFSQIGVGGGSPIIRSSVVEYTDFIMDISKTLLEAYKAKFMHNSTLLNKLDDNYYLDIFVHKFIQDSKLFETYDYRSSSILVNPNEFKYIDEFEIIQLYNRSIFELLDSKYDYTNINDNLLKTHVFIKHMPKFGDTLYYDYSDRNILLSNTLTNPNTDISNKFIHTVLVVSDEFVSKLITPDDNNIELDLLESLLYNLHTGKYLPQVVNTSLTDTFSLLISDLNNAELMNSSKSYWLVPIILYKVKQHIEIYHSGV